MSTRLIINEDKRYRQNLVLFIISFTLSNLLSGIVYDTYINYLQEVALNVSTSFWSYYGYATFISALMLLLVNKIGYKWTLLFCPIGVLGALLAILYINSGWVYKLMTILALVGLQLHYAILSPYVATYTNNDNRTLWYSRTYWIGYSGWAITTYLGGLLTVLRFAARSNYSFDLAKSLTKNIDALNPVLKSNYIAANRDVLFLAAILALVSILPVLFIRQEKEDYKLEARPNDPKFLSKNFKVLGSLVKNKYVLSFIFYSATINFAMGLFTPYFTIFLNRGLHIDRSTASLLISISYSAMIIFTMFTPSLVKRFGQVVVLTSSVLLSIPFMVIIANGNKFNGYTSLIVGLALFIRSGLANLNSPIESSLPMEIVEKDQRTALSSLLNIIIGLMSILSGKFTGNFLFINRSGYFKGYYIASVLYGLAAINIFLVFFRKFNKKEGE